MSYNDDTPINWEELREKQRVFLSDQKRHERKSPPKRIDRRALLSISSDSPPKRIDRRALLSISDSNSIERIARVSISDEKYDINPIMIPKNYISFGLKIRDTNINRISGPVSMYYLKPDPKIFELYKNQINFPLILAFGDIHQGYDNVCENCELDCVNIYDKKFLQDIDKLALTYPIDFFTESSEYFIESELSGQGILFDKFLAETVLPCHKANMRKRDVGSYLKNCPTKNIRWHYTDSRHFYHKFEGFLISSNITYLSNIISDFKNKKEISPKINIDNIDFVDLSDNFTYEFLNKFVSLIKINSDIDYITDQLALKFGELYIDTINSIKKDSSLYKELSSEGLDSDVLHIYKLKIFNSIVHSLKSDVYKKAVENIVNFVNRNEKYIVYFEDLIKLMSGKISKKYYPNIRLYNPLDESRWEERWDNTNRKLYYADLTNESTTWERPVKKYAGPVYSSIISELENTIYTITANLLKLFLTSTSAVLLDIYFITRLFKNPVGNLNSSLSLCYFGDNHITNVVRILKDIFNYEEVFAKGSNLRCINIDKDLNVFEDLKEHELLRGYESKKDIYLKTVI